MERIIPINLAGDDSPTSPPPQPKAGPSAPAAPKPAHQPLRFVEGFSKLYHTQAIFHPLTILHYNVVGVVRLRIR